MARNPLVVPLDELRRRGLIALGVTGTLSATASLSLLIFLVPRYVSSKAKAQTENWKSASLLLIINLLIADLLQALAWGLMSFYWLNMDTLTALSRACLLQGFLINWADLASAFFVLSIALGTWWTLWMERCINYNKMQFMICVIWLFPLFISLLGPLTMNEYFTPVESGAWVSTSLPPPLHAADGSTCWVNEKYKRERLVYHYMWLFIVEGALIIIYGCIFIHLRRLRAQVAHYNHGNNSGAISPKKITRLAAFMLMYPTAFIIGTFPLSAGRMVTFTHPELLAREYWIGAAVCICSCGLTDSILYASTRRTAFRAKKNLGDTLDEAGPGMSSVDERFRPESISSSRLSSSSTCSPVEQTRSAQPDSPYSMPNDTTGSLNTNTPLTREGRSSRAANFSSPSPSVYSKNQGLCSESGFVRPRARPQLSLRTDIYEDGLGDRDGYGYPSERRGAGDGIHVEEMRKELRY